MTDLPDGQEQLLPAAAAPRVLILDLAFGPSAYPEDGITWLERWAHWDPPNDTVVGAITKTTTTVRRPFRVD
ncbi:hypothetical protein ACIA5G_39190 [Amycolatopsis sp. NPDC051758]|uniref:hypothetical protein n=1 Tax=Amycolatopsis sp. NPDC051758 TaxID=3363935 RepID=UPI0037AEF31A